MEHTTPPFLLASREWQMERAFQTALWLLQPEVVFILGDIFDEGKWSSPEVGMHPQAWGCTEVQGAQDVRSPGAGCRGSSAHNRRLHVPAGSGSCLSV